MMISFYYISLGLSMPFCYLCNFSFLNNIIIPFNCDKILLCESDLELLFQFIADFFFDTP